MDWATYTSGFIPRAHCGDWPMWLMTTYIIASIGIAICYFTIPAILLVRNRKRGIGANGLVFPAFIVSCGVTRLLDALMFVFPAYRLLAMSLVLTLLISLTAVINLAHNTNEGRYDGRGPNG